MKKNVIHIIVANIFLMIVTIGTNFLLPKFTSIETYAATKEYTLYITTYSELLTLGYIQGMYLKYGGINIERISTSEISKNIISFLVFQLPIAIIVTILGFILKNDIIIILGAGILASNMVSYFQLLYQATGEFKEYGVALNANRVLIFIAYLIFIFILKTDNYMLYVITTPVLELCVVVYLTVKLNRKMHFLKVPSFSIKEIKQNVNGGIILMLGNFTTRFFSTIDRWFVKYFLGTVNFAIFSFSVSMEQVINTFMTPITVSMYNYFCKKPSDKEIYRVKEVTLIYSVIIISAAFPAKWILEKFMQEYVSAIKIIFPLFAAQGLNAIIKGIYVNKYKAEKKQNKYLKQMIVMLILAVVLNGAFYKIYKDVLSIAMATFITSLVWLIVCEIDDKVLRFNMKSTIAMVIMLSIYFITGYNLNSILGFVVYCCAGLVVGIIFMPESFKYIASLCIKVVHKKINR